MEQKTLQYVKEKFKEYYIKHHISAPPEISRREFGFWTDAERKLIPIRHKSFKSESELNLYLRTIQPFFHISYSMAYYEFPENEIDKKNWLGADLIFDFDVKMEFIEFKKIEEIRDEVLKLFDFLKDDFGFSANDIRINFSGSKGFHVKVFDERIRKLGKEERREILDYITANTLLKDIKKSKFFEVREDSRSGREMSDKRKWDETKTGILIGPKIDDVGWGKRIAISAIEILKEEENNKRLGEEKRRRVKEILEDVQIGKWEKFREYIPNLKNKIKKRAVNLTADTDRQVTQDISRLIRLENTLHGMTALIAKTIDNIENFDIEKNFKEFIAFSETDTEISANDDFKFWLINNFELKKGINKVPEYVAIYLMLKGKAEVK